MQSKIACTKKIQDHHCDIFYKSFLDLFKHFPLKKLICPIALWHLDKILIHVMSSFLKLLHPTMPTSLNVIMQNPTPQSTKTLTNIRRKLFYNNVFAILLSSLLMANCSCIKATCTTQMEKREVWVYPSNGFKKLLENGHQSEFQWFGAWHWSYPFQM
jgi:hypothetical protein